MKRCPSCNSSFDDEELNFCPNDGTGLVRETPPAPVELQATMMAPPPQSLGGASYPPPPDPSGPGSGSGSGSGSFNPPTSNQTWQNQQTPQNPSWPTPATPQASAPPKSGGMNKKLLFAGIGCVGLGGIVVIIGIVLLVVLSGPAGKMNPYKGNLQELTPEYVGGYKRVDMDALGDKDKKELGQFNEGLGVAYKVSTTNVQMFVSKYSSSKDADEGLKTFKDSAVGEGFTASELEKKKLGWRTVGGRYVFTKSPSTGKADDKVLPDGAAIVQVQAQPSPTPEKKQSQIVAWTNGSVVIIVLSDGTNAVDFEKIYDGIGK